MGVRGWGLEGGGGGIVAVVVMWEDFLRNCVCVFVWWLEGIPYPIEQRVAYRSCDLISISYLIGCWDGCVRWVG